MTCHNSLDSTVITVVGVHLLWVGVGAVSEMEPLGSAHRDLDVFVVLRIITVAVNIYPSDMNRKCSALREV